MSFGYALRRFREERGLSLRELGKLSEIDHAYIHRLERDEKTAPSDEVVGALARALKLSARRAELLRQLVGQQSPEQLVEIFIDDHGPSLGLFAPLAEMSFRGKRPITKEDWRRWADRLSKLMTDEASE